MSLERLKNVYFLGAMIKNFKAIYDKVNEVVDYINNNPSSSLPYTSCVWLLSQSGTNDPAVIELVNEIGIDSSLLTRDSAGDYYIDEAYNFDVDKIVVLIGNSGAGGNPATFAAAQYTSSGYFYIQTRDVDGLSADGLLGTAGTGYTTLEIRVYN